MTPVARPESEPAEVARAVSILYFTERLTPREIGLVVGLTESRVLQLLAAIRDERR